MDCSWTPPVWRGLVRPAGFEPATPCLEGRCSIQLSYGRLSGLEGRLERVSRRTLDLASFLDQGLLITGYTVPGPSKNIVPFPMQVHPARQRV